MADNVQVTVNGDAKTITAGQTVVDLLRSLDIDPLHSKGIAVAVNDEVVRRASSEDVALKADDRLDVITARQGGGGADACRPVSCGRLRHLRPRYGCTTSG